ncbi:MAG: hypothetical protein DRH04_09895 [Deltaproteobacteria bacterium]|nr:MAG: hypothetical protein DRH04_09895 [Deltaproteobacteria bacterium]
MGSQLSALSSQLNHSFFYFKCFTESQLPTAENGHQEINISGRTRVCKSCTIKTTNHHPP